MASNRHPTEDVVRDERANRQNGPVVDERTIRGHHVDTLWLGTGVHMPVHTNGPHRHRRRRHKRPRDPSAKPEMVESEADKKRFLPPAQRVHFLLSHDDEAGGGANGEAQAEAHRIFSEMVELHGTDANQEWRETARWVKFEEDVEEGGNRWSKPHVATLSLHSLFELRSCIMNGSVILDMEANDFGQIIDIMLDKMIAAKHIDDDQREAIRDALMRKHTHQYEHAKSGGKDKDANLHPGQSFLQTVRSIADIGRSFSHAKNLQTHDITVASAPGPISSPGVSTGGASVGSHPQLMKQESVPHAINASGQLQLPKVSSLPKDMVRESSTADATKCVNESSTKRGSFNNPRRMPTSQSTQSMKGNHHFFKKLPPGAEASNVLIGMVEFLEHHVAAFIRLKNAQMLGNLTEVPVPTRFLFILLGPSDHGPQYREIGRAIATLMSDEVFHEVAYKAQSRSDLLDGVDEFLDQVTVLPPGEWDPNIRIEPPTSIPSQEKRKAPDQPKLTSEEAVATAEEEEGHGMDPALKRTGRLFGGLITDIKRKAPFYLSDFKDSLNLQCVAALMFMYFAMLAPIVTFGGLLDEATEKRMGAMENLLSGAICGTLYHIFSGQPLTMIGSTGPVLVFEKIMYEICKRAGWDFLSFRLWINLWSGIILILMVATDASALVSYITRFTEESFAALISFIFIYESIAKLMAVGSSWKTARTIEWDAYSAISPFTSYNCTCLPPSNETYLSHNAAHDLKEKIQKYEWNPAGWLYNSTTGGPNSTDFNYTVDWNAIPMDFCEHAKGHLIGDCYVMWDIFLMSALLMLGTFTIAMTLKLCRNSTYFPSKARELLSNFAVIIAITLMVLLDYLVGLRTPKLSVPDRVKPTWDGRTWIIDPFGNVWWTSILAIVPALLMCILLFMDQQITVVIVNRKENKLKKGCGYHLDLFVLAILVVVVGFLGLPIFVAATVMSISHVNALRVESECRAPGEKPTFIGVREQRVTGLVVFLLIAVSVLMTNALKAIPMPVLYGVFLYMGVSSLRGVQMVDRLMLLFMPMKYQPDYVYLRHVPIKRVHLFTAFQLGCFIVLCVIKEIKMTSIVFPLMLVVMVGVRKLMEYVFSERELKYLDDKMPEIAIRKKEDAKKKKEQLQLEQAESAAAEEATERQKFTTVCTEANLHIPLASGNVMKIPLSSIADQPATSSSGGGGGGAGQRPPPLNLSEELNKSGLWKHIESETSFAHKDDVERGYPPPPPYHHHYKPKDSSFTKKGSGTNLSSAAAVKSPPPIADDECEPITIKIDRASPVVDRGDDATARNETQPLLGDQKTTSDKSDKQESSV